MRREGNLVERSVRVAVLVTIYNGQRWLSEQLYSILNQANVDVTVFLSVDGFFLCRMSWSYCVWLPLKK